MANLSEFGSSLETTRHWIDELKETLETGDEAKACRAFRVTTQELRDHMTVEEAADFAAQLPLLLRGVFYEGWRPSGKPSKDRSGAKFLNRIGEFFNGEPHEEHVEMIVRDVFKFLNKKISPGEINDVFNCLPKEIRALWPQEAGNTRATRLIVVAEPRRMIDQLHSLGSTSIS